MQNPRPHSSSSRPAALGWIIVILLGVNLGLFLFPGCQNSRDSGSTVTGRALQFPIGNALPFARVLVNGEEAVRLQVTDSTGAFTMYHVPKGVYSVTFARFGLELHSQDLVIDRDEDVYVVNLPSMQPGIVTLVGSVIDPDKEEGVPGADIWLVYPGGGVAHTVSGAKGLYGFANLSDGEITVVATAPGYELELMRGIRVGFEGVAELDIELNAAIAVEGGRVHGLVSGIEGEALDEAYIGAFIGGTELSIFTPAVDEVHSTTDGYALENLPPGAYLLICTRSGYAPKTATVSVEEGGDYEVGFVLGSDEYLWRSSEEDGLVMLGPDE